MLKIKSIAVFTLLAASMSLSAAPADGTYQESVMGHNAKFNLEVTIQNGRITKIVAPGNLESPGVGKLAIKKMADRIIDNQSINVDGISGATLTSFAVKQAVGKALKKAGADDSFKKKVKQVSALPDTIQSEVVIIGGGGAGLAAAVSALQNGAKVTIVEKLGFLGGSNNVCGGAFNASDTRY